MGICPLCFPKMDTNRSTSAGAQSCSEGGRIARTMESVRTAASLRNLHERDNSPANRAVMTHWQLIRVTTAANVRLTARSCTTHTPISKFWKTRSGSGELRRAGARDWGPDSGNRHRRGGPTSPGNHGAHFLVARGRRDGQHQKRSTFLY